MREDRRLLCESEAARLSGMTAGQLRARFKGLEWTKDAELRDGQRYYRASALPRVPSAHSRVVQSPPDDGLPGEP